MKVYIVDDILKLFKEGFKIKNNIKNLLIQKNISINSLSKAIDMNYANTHHLVNRDDLGNTKLKTLKSVADYLDVKLIELWKN